MATAVFYLHFASTFSRTNSISSFSYLPLPKNPSSTSAVRRKLPSSLGLYSSPSPTPSPRTRAVGSPAALETEAGEGDPKILLEVRDLKASIAESGEEILRGVNLTIREGQVTFFILILIVCNVWR